MVMREFFVMAVSSFPYPFVIFVAAATAGVALTVLRDHLRKIKKLPQNKPHPLLPLDEIYND